VRCLRQNHPTMRRRGPSYPSKPSSRITVFPNSMSNPFWIKRAIDHQTPLPFHQPKGDFVRSHPFLNKNISRPEAIRENRPSSEIQLTSITHLGKCPLQGRVFKKYRGRHLSKKDLSSKFLIHNMTFPACARFCFSLPRIPSSRQRAPRPQTPSM
jgi:hypothetical protein